MLLIFCLCSTLLKHEIEELTRAELDSREEIILNKTLLPESFSLEALKGHVQSIYCSIKNEEVSLFDAFFKYCSN